VWQASSLFNPFNNYATAVKGELQRFLARNKELRQRAYKVDVLIWVTREGRMNRFELRGSSGDTEVDDLIRQSLSTLGTFSGAPPEKMPQPIHLRLVTGRALIGCGRGLIPNRSERKYFSVEGP